MTPGRLSEDGVLDGLRIGVTADRRSLDLITGFTGLGASVLHAPTLRIGMLRDPAPLLAATRALITDPPDDLVLTSAAGLLHWRFQAEVAGTAADLEHVLRGARVLARGARSREVALESGFELAPLSTGHTAEIVDHLLAEGVDGRRIAVQVHPGADPGLPALLTAAGADVVVVRPYEWEAAPDPTLVRQLIGRIGTRRVDAVVFNSAAAAEAFVAATVREGQLTAVRDALAQDVLASTIGPVAAGPLWAAGLRALPAAEPTFPGLVAFTAGHLARTRAAGVVTPAGVLRVREDGVRLDGEPVEVSGAPLAVLQVLARRPGAVFDRASLARSLPRVVAGAGSATPVSGDLHAVETAVARLRAAVGHSGVVETVTKRGYRLATVDGPARRASGEHPA